MDDQNTHPVTAAPADVPRPTDTRVAIHVLLDRSGSMAMVADDVIGGFNRFLADQRADGDDAVLTLVQFDSVNPEEVVVDAAPIAEVRPLDAATFVPRASTPLLDATARLLARASARDAARATAGLPPEEVVVVSITDGHENASREVRLREVRELIEQRRRQGWTFVFLGAAPDVYGEAGGLGYDDRSVQAFAADGAGTSAAFESLSHSTANMRRKVRVGERRDKDDFFEGEKPAEFRRRRRGT
ncbi:MAG: VWA domain-containing protein [Microthrixaceae bacterium]